MRVLVTGANGFVGKSICQELLKNSYQIYKIINQNSLKMSVSRKEELYQTFVCDISDKDSVSKSNSIKKVDVVIHCAGIAHQFGKLDEKRLWEVNVNGTRNICELSLRLKAKQFIQISSVSVYGKKQFTNQDFAIDENHICNPEDLYGKSKLAAENVCRQIFEETDTKLTILRLVTVVGEGDKGNVLRLIKLIDKRKFFWVGNGENKKSLIYVSDVSRAAVQILSKENAKTDIFNITAKEVSMSEIVHIAAKSLDKKIPNLKISYKLLKESFNILNWVTNINKFQNLSNSLEKWVSNDIFSGEKIFRKFGFKPKVSVEEAIEKEIAWYLKSK